MNLFGIVVVRNEADVIRLSLLHHLSLGLDTILVLDNGSTDGTSALLERMSRDDVRIQWSTDTGLFHQVAARTELAREALRQGADWVVPFDADEFWWVRRGALRDKLAASTAGALSVPVINFIQRRDRSSASEDGLLTMTRRPLRPIGLGEPSVDAGEIAFTELRYPPKWIFRPAPDIVVEPGNHALSGVAGAGQEALGVACLHAPLRSRACLERKADHGLRALQTGSPPDHSWHLKRWARLRAEGVLDREWAANSYEDITIDVYGNERPLTVDLRLRDIVAPFLGREPSPPEREEVATRSAARRATQRRYNRSVDRPASESSPITAARAVSGAVSTLDPESQRFLPTHADPWRPTQHAVTGADEGTIAFLRSTACRVIAEVGIYEGYTSRRIAEYLNGAGELHLFDFSDRVDAVEAALNQAGYHNVVGHGNSRKLFDSYNWSLMRVLQQHATPIYDYVFLDGGHVWALDALAFLLIDRLLKPGGYIDFDDYYWSLAISPSLNPTAFPMTAEMYTDEQIREQQVKLVVDLLVKRDLRYEEVVQNKIFRKKESATAASD